MIEDCASADPAALLVGRNRNGQWIVRDRTGRHGGIFINRAAALGYARLVTGHRKPTVVMVGEHLELNAFS